MGQLKYFILGLFVFSLTPWAGLKSDSNACLSALKQDSARRFHHREWRKIYNTGGDLPPENKPKYQGPYWLEDFTHEELYDFVQKDGIWDEATNSIIPFQNLQIKVVVKQPAVLANQALLEFSPQKQHAVEFAGRGYSTEAFFIVPKADMLPKIPVMAVKFKKLSYLKLQLKEQGLIQDGFLRLWLLNYSMLRFFVTKAHFGNGPLYALAPVLSKKAQLETGAIWQLPVIGKDIWELSENNGTNPSEKSIDMENIYGLSPKAFHDRTEALEQFLSDIHLQLTVTHKVLMQEVSNAIPHGGGRFPVVIDYLHGKNLHFPEADKLPPGFQSGVPIWIDW